MKIRLFATLSSLASFAVAPAYAQSVLTMHANTPEMREAALVVGNLGFGPTDGIMRYNGLGKFIDNMIPTGVGNELPCCMTFGPDENLYVSRPFSSEVRRYNGVTGAFVDTFIPAGSGGLMVPLILLFHEGYLYVGDTGTGAIRRYDAKTGAYVDNFIPDNSQGMGNNLGDQQSFAFGPDGNLYVSAQISKRVLRYDGQSGIFINDLIPSDSGFNPDEFVFGPDGLLYIGDYQTAGEVRRYDVRSGTYEVFIPAGGRLSMPVGMAFGPDGNFYVTSVGTAEILRYCPAGRFLGALVTAGSGGLTGPRVIEWKVKTTVCHRPGGNRVKGKTLTIGYLSAGDHLAHGDTLGACQ